MVQPIRSPENPGTTVVSIGHLTPWPENPGYRTQVWDNDYTAPIFEKYELLNIENSCIYCAPIFLYKHHQKILPEVFSDFFEINNVVHDHYTRQGKHFYVPLCKSSPKSQCLRCFGVKISIYMIEQISYKYSYVSFKYALKGHLLGNDMTQLLPMIWI